MAQIVQQGALNILGLVVPDAIVQIIPPQPPVIGAPSNIYGLVGGASWGPVGVAVPVGGNDQANQNFGPITNRKSDLSTAVAVAVQQGCSAMKCVRATDTTDTSASGSYATSETAATATIAGSLTVGNVLTLTATPTVGAAISWSYTTKGGDTPTTMAAGLLAAFQASAAPAAGLGASVAGPVVNVYSPSATPGPWTLTSSVSAGGTETITIGSATASTTKLTLTGLYTGIVGNSILATLQPGSAAGSTKLVLARPNFVPEVFDNIVGTGNAFWQSLANAVNVGNSPVRGPSQLCIASAGPGVAVPPSTATTVTLSGGTDGAGTLLAPLADSVLLGSDVAPRKGVYALRNQGCSVAVLADHSTSTQWTSLVAFAQSEGLFIASSTPVGDVITNAPTELATAGIDAFSMKVFFGDWLYWWDGVNTVLRLLAPATFWGGLRANLSPQNSALNKRINGIVGSQKTLSGGTWSNVELQTMLSARLDIIANPAPGGTYWTTRGGINTSSNGGTNGENYTMMTDWLAQSIGGWAGQIVGELQTPDQRREAKGLMDDYFNSQWVLGMIGNADSANGIGAPPWSVTLNDKTTPPSLADLGYEIAAVMVQYLSVIRWFIANLAGGQTVQVTVSATPPAATTA